MKRILFLLCVTILSSTPIFAGLTDNKTTEGKENSRFLFSPKFSKLPSHVKKQKRRLLKRTKARYGDEFENYIIYLNLCTLFEDANSTELQKEALKDLNHYDIDKFDVKDQADLLKMKAILKIKLGLDDNLFEAFEQLENHNSSTITDIAILRFHLINYYLHHEKFNKVKTQLDILQQSMLSPDLHSYLTLTKIIIDFSFNMMPDSDDELEAQLDYLEGMITSRNFVFAAKNKLPTYSSDELTSVHRIMSYYRDFNQPDEDLDAGAFIEEYNELEADVNELPLDTVFQKTIKLRCNLLGFHLFHEDRNVGYDNHYAWIYLKATLRGFHALVNNKTSFLTADSPSWSSQIQKMVDIMPTLGNEEGTESEVEELGLET